MSLAGFSPPRGSSVAGASGVVKGAAGFSIFTVYGRAERLMLCCAQVFRGPAGRSRCIVSGCALPCAAPELPIPPCCALRAPELYSPYGTTAEKPHTKRGFKARRNRESKKAQ